MSTVAGVLSLADVPVIGYSTDLTWLVEAGGQFKRLAPVDLVIDRSQVTGLEGYLSALGSGLSTEIATARAAEALKAPLDSPALTGTPTAPTAAAGTSTTQLATTEFTTVAIAAEATARAAADVTLQSHIDAEASTARAAEAANATAISAETTRAQAV